jgi:hypothetical protein
MRRSTFGEPKPRTVLQVRTGTITKKIFYVPVRVPVVPQVITGAWSLECMGTSTNRPKQNRIWGKLEKFGYQQKRPIIQVFF